MGKEEIRTNYFVSNFEPNYNNLSTIANLQEEWSKPSKDYHWHNLSLGPNSKRANFPNIFGKQLQ